MSAYEEKPWRRAYPDGMPYELQQNYANMVSLWDSTVSRSGDRPFLHYFDRSYSFNQVDRLADALAVGLLEGGLQHSDRVGIYLQNDPQWPVTQLAVWKAGGIVVPLNPMLKADELGHLLRDAGVSVLVCMGGLHDVAAEAIRGDSSVTRILVSASDRWLGAGATDVLPPDAGYLPNQHVEILENVIEDHAGSQPASIALADHDVAMLTYTSGTTGPPKGAMNTHGNIAYNSQVCEAWFSLNESDVILGIAPLFHITGSVAHLGMSQISGASVVLFHRFDPARALEMIETHGVTVSVAAITAYIAMMDHPAVGERDLSSLAKLASGGAPVSPSVVDRFQSTTGAYIHNVYGLTETTSPSHCTPLGSRPPIDPQSGALSVGVPVMGAMVRVVDTETRRELPTNTVGELTVEGPMVVPGYWGKPEETSHAIPNGRLHTGDVGFMNEDGWFFIVDRAKDQINASGYKVWPRDVEDVLYQHEAVREAAVVGVPDEYRGETVKAYVSLAGGQDVSAVELQAFCRERIAAYKYPRQIEIMEELPKTPTGKLLRRELRERELSGGEEQL